MEEEIEIYESPNIIIIKNPSPLLLEFMGYLKLDKENKRKEMEKN